jgi:ubiquinone/menaquinone biosynthesis C-methylase UbiE
VTDHRVIDEQALAGREHLDPGYVARYDRKAGLDPGSDIDLLRAHGLGPASTVIDFGAGTGIFAIAAASVCRLVTAVDASPAMVDALTEKARHVGATNVECVQAGFLTYTHDGPPVDVVYTRNALHHLPDLWKAIALKRMADMLVPGAILRLRDLVFSFELSEAEAGIDEWLHRAASPRPDEGWTRQELEAHLRDEHSTFTWLLEPMIERAGFAIAEATYGASGADAAYLCVRRAP